MKTLLAMVVAVALAGCAPAPTIDWIKADKSCSAHCTDGYNQCTQGFSMTPLLAQHGCNESLKVCASSCGGTVTSN